MSRSVGQDRVRQIWFKTARGWAYSVAGLETQIWKAQVGSKVNCGDTFLSGQGYKGLTVQRADAQRSN